MGCQQLLSSKKEQAKHNQLSVGKHMLFVKTSYENIIRTQKETILKLQTFIGEQNRINEHLMGRVSALERERKKGGKGEREESEEKEEKVAERAWALYDEKTVPKKANTKFKFEKHPLDYAIIMEKGTRVKSGASPMHDGCVVSKTGFNSGVFIWKVKCLGKCCRLQVSF